MNVRRFALNVFIGMALLLASCSSTTITGVWKKNDYAGPPMQSLVIFAQTGDKYNRSDWENSIADRFLQSNMDAVPAARVFSDMGNIQLDQLIPGAWEKGIDGVLVIRHIDTRIEKRHHPPTTEYYASWWDYYPTRRRGYYPRYRGRYGYYPYYRRYPPYLLYSYPVHEVVVTPGYTTFHRVVLVESFLYQARLRELIWSVSTSTYDPESDEYLLAEISGTVFSALRKYGLVELTR